jgi:BRCT domain type II-containing protein
MSAVGVNGANANSLSGKTIVLTGVFPQIGGGTGLNLGKAKLKSMCEALGAKVTSAVSIRTDILLVGEEPGASKVSKARSQSNCKLVNIDDMKFIVEGTKKIEDVQEDAVIETYSKGYGLNAITLPKEEEDFIIVRESEDELDKKQDVKRKSKPSKSKVVKKPKVLQNSNETNGLNF